MGSSIPAAYPVAPLQGDADDRFTTGLLFDVRDVLTRHGYPQITSGLDLVDLRQALFGFLYGNNERRAGA